MDMQIKLSEALLGVERTVPTLDGEIVLKIPSCTNTGTILRVKGRGVPRSTGRAKDRGDIYVRIFVRLPEKISKEQRKLIEELRKQGL